MVAMQAARRSVTEEGATTSTRLKERLNTFHDWRLRRESAAVWNLAPLIQDGHSTARLAVCIGAIAEAAVIQRVPKSLVAGLTRTLNHLYHLTLKLSGGEAVRLERPVRHVQHNYGVCSFMADSLCVTPKKLPEFRYVTLTTTPSLTM